jgi:hypothetical protein
MPPLNFSARASSKHSEDDTKRPKWGDRAESGYPEDNLEGNHQEHVLKCSTISRMSPTSRPTRLSTGNSFATSTVTSESSMQSPTNQSFYSLTHRPTASLHLSLSAYPTEDRLHADVSGTLWVAIEVSGSVHVDDESNFNQNMTCFGPSLAVGVVIDNS